MKKKAIYRFALAGLLMAIAPVYANALEDELVKNPVSAISDFYIQNETKVTKLRNDLLQADQSLRQASFAELIQDFPEAAEVTSRTLVNDENSAIALMAVGFLKQNLVMTNHSHTNHVNMEDLEPNLKFIMEKHEASRVALRKAVTDSRVEVRKEAASFLASQSDEVAFAGISEGVAKGLYTQVEAANYFSLGKPVLGQKYLGEFIGKGDLGAQKTAIEYLGFFPKYQDQIKSTYFVNSTAPPELRAEAASTLSKFDPNYPEYALIVLSSDTNPLFYEASVAGYVEALSTKGTLDPKSAGLLDLKIQDFVNKSAGGTPENIKLDLNNLQEKLKSISGGLN